MAECIAIDKLLGSLDDFTAAPSNPLQWVQVIRHGIPSSSIEVLASILCISHTELASILGVPYRTLARRKREGLLNSEESAKMVRVARVVERAEVVFGSLGLAVDWLKSPNAAMTGVTPLSLMDTDMGAESVLDTLGRIEHGVFA